MESPFWHVYGILSAVGFVIAIVLSVWARRLFVSTNRTDVMRGAAILSSLGGAANARSVQKDLHRRNIS